MTSLTAIELVLFFTRSVALSTWDEVGTIAREVALYKALLAHVKSIHFVTYGGPEDELLSNQFQGIQLVNNRWGISENWYARWLEYLAALPKHSMAIYKSNQMLGADIALRAARRRGAKFIARCGYLHSHNTEKEHGVDSVNAQKARALEAQVFPAADRIVVTTDRIRQQIVERYKLPEEKIAVIPNYVLDKEFAPTNVSKNMINRICFVGRLSFEKNIEALIEALVGLDVELLIIGNGELRPQLERVAEDNNVVTRFLGKVRYSELPSVLNSCKLFVLPSLYEGHPKALLEAMSCGLPVIGTNVPGIREIIEHRENGYLADPTVEGLRSAIEQVLSDDELQRHMGANARQYVLENVSLEKVVKLELALLESLLLGSSA